MKATELSRRQLEALKQSYLCDTRDSVSYGELAEADSLVSDSEIFEAYDGMDFTAEDFFD